MIRTVEKKQRKRKMDSPRLFSGFIMLFVLCLLQHNCTARKVLLDDHPKMQQIDTKLQGEVMMKADQLDMNDVTTQGGIGVGCGFSGCECFEGNCHGGEVVVPQPPHVIYPPPLVIPTPPEVVPTPPYIYPIPTPPCTTPCEPWYGPGPCPCPCEEEGDHKEGVDTEGHKSSNNKDSQEGEKLAKKVSLHHHQSGTSATAASQLDSNNGKVSGEVHPGKLKTDGASNNGKVSGEVHPGKLKTDGASNNGKVSDEVPLDKVKIESATTETAEKIMVTSEPVIPGHRSKQDGASNNGKVSDEVPPGKVKVDRATTETIIPGHRSKVEKMAMADPPRSFFQG